MSNGEDDRNNGYACPKCGSHKCPCYESRFRPHFKYRWRRRECEDCGLRFTTFEVWKEDYIGRLAYHRASA